VGFRIPDWLIYGAAVAALLGASVVGRGHDAAPPAPPAADAQEGALMGPPAGFDPLDLTPAPGGPLQQVRATAFAISGEGRWLTALHVVASCRKAAVLLGGGLAVPAEVRAFKTGDLALLISKGGATPLPLAAPKAPREGAMAFTVGFPHGRPGEMALRYIGRDTLSFGGRGAPDLPVMVWAEAGRTDDLHGSLTGLAGAPVVDGEGRVLGVTLANRPRRGLVYTTAPETLAPAIKILGAARDTAVGEPISAENYGRVADALRRDTRVAEVRCLQYR
jgi:S1-C subfamily serine protease